MKSLYLLLPVLAVLLAGCPPVPQRVSEGIMVVIDLDAKGDAQAAEFAANPVGFLEGGLTWYDQHVNDYTCTLYKRERMDPRAADFLPEQKLACKFKENPFSLLTETLVNPRGAYRSLYVETVGQKNWKMKATAKVLGLPLTVEVEPRGPEARQYTLRFVDQFGFKRGLEQIIRTLKAIQEEKIAKGGEATRITVQKAGKVGDRDVLIFEYWLKEAKPTGRFEFPHGRVYLDREWRLVLGVDLYDANDIERGRFLLTDIKFNVGLTDAMFTPKANGM